MHWERTISARGFGCMGDSYESRATLGGKGVWCENGMTATPTRPILRYHGGKWRLSPWIIQHMPKHRVYTETFGGAASVLLRKPRSYAEIYNDMDHDIVNLFRVAREDGQSLVQALRLTPFSRDEFNGSYEISGDPLEMARRTIIRSFMGFGSNSHIRVNGFRSNSNRSGTTPAHDWATYPGCLSILIERLKGVCIENRDAAEIIIQHDYKEAFHYVDPPYVAVTRDSGRDYRFEMTDEDHRSLAKTLLSCDGKVCLSGYHSALYDELYGDWRRVERKAHADGARDRVEVLWMNYEAEDLLL